MPPLLLVLLAVPVCAGALIVLALSALYAWATGNPPALRDALGGGIFGVLSVVVVVLSLRAVWNARHAPAFRVYGALLVTLCIGGVLGGLAFAQQMIGDAEAEMARATSQACGRFDMPSASCPEVARACVYAVRRNPPVVPRGMQPPPEDPRAPSDPRERAIHECIQRGGP